MAAINDDSAKKKRGRGKPFEKGVSGNPSGRPKMDARVAAALKAASFDAAQTLIELMGDPNAPAKVRLAAANSILDRAYGKPTQAFSMEGEQPLIKITLSDELAAYTK